jgi:hypothetical protein
MKRNRRILPRPTSTSVYVGVGYDDEMYGRVRVERMFSDYDLAVELRAGYDPRTQRAAGELSVAIEF